MRPALNFAILVLFLLLSHERVKEEKDGVSWTEFNQGSETATEKLKSMERVKESLLDQVACAISWLTCGSGHSLGLRQSDPVFKQGGK